MDPFDLRLWAGFASAGGDASLPAIVDQISIDSRSIHSKHALFVPLEGKSQNGHNFIRQAAHAGARYALAKNGWKPTQPLNGVTILYVPSPLKAFQQIAAAYRKQLACRIVAIAGSYGKTMVKDLLQTMLATTHAVAASPGSFNSQIGVPLSLLTINKNHQIALIEAAFSQPDEMDILSEIISPDYAVITHVGKKHIATLGNKTAIAAEMVKLLTPLSKQGWTILPRDPCLLPHLHSKDFAYYFWNENLSNFPQASIFSNEKGGQIPYCVSFPDGRLHRGHITEGFYYFIDLISIALKAAWLLNVPSKDVSAVLENYKPEPMRTEIWRSPSGATFINDMYCSDPQSVEHSLKYLQQTSPGGRKIFAFGGMRSHLSDCELEYKRIGKSIQNANIDMLFLYGSRPFDPLIHEMQTIERHPEIYRCPTYSNTLELLKDRIKQNDAVLIKGETRHSLDTITEAFNDSICSNCCVINLAAISANLAVVRKKLAPETRIMVIVKALAYGTDAIRMSQFLKTCDVDILGVSYVDEGVTLKQAGVDQAIFVINAAPYEAAKVVKWDLEAGVSNKVLIEAIALEASRQNKKIKVHLHVDTGMSRFGCRQEESLELAQFIASRPSLIFEGIMTHLACADDPDNDAFTFMQAQRFEEAIDRLKRQGFSPPWSHAVNSSGALRFGFPQFNMARIGLAVYGLHSSQATKRSTELRLALSLTSRIVGINVCKKGETISYGRCYEVQREAQRIAVLPIGYFDGLHRNYSGKSAVIIRGQKAPMVGKICMDFMMVDVTDIPNASPGDQALIFGEDEYGNYVSPEDLATKGDSIIHELISCLGPRIPRIFVYEENSNIHEEEQW